MNFQSLLNGAHIYFMKMSLKNFYNSNNYNKFNIIASLIINNNNHNNNYNYNNHNKICVI